MTDSPDQTAVPAIPSTTDATTSIDQPILAKRRKVRKGTRSCWECKRRKTKCIFVLSEDATCIGCQRRRAPCISQHMPEDLAPVKGGNRHLTERISRVEDLMNGFLADKEVVAQVQGNRGLTTSGPPKTRSDDSTLPTTSPTPVHVRKKPMSLSIRILIVTQSLKEPICNSSLAPDCQGLSGQPETETALHHLLAAFPADEDANILLRASSIPSLYTELVNTQPHSKLTPDRLAAPCSKPEFPSLNIHPIKLARLMLTFAITLQIPHGEEFVGLSEPKDTLMRRLVTAATTWVTTKQEMHATVEGLICILFEGAFETNRGNLRRAWSVYRRAMTVAQLMGLHRSRIPPLTRIDPDLDANPGFLWFRIVYMDRYLSLLLGLPQGTSDKSMGDMSVLHHEPPLGQFERLLTVIASRILERNETPFDRNNITTTMSIDSELLRLSKSMPASFWRTAEFHHDMPGSPNALLETLRLAAQVYYFGLLIQLHLPYMMRGGDRTEHQYSRMTCVNASRETMARFIAHRNFNPMSSCSRPVDFFALLAAMSLLLAHLGAHHNPGATSVLAHQRSGDRAMLGQAVERMDAISSVNNDAITEKSAMLIRKLLNIEADASEGISYTTSLGGDVAQEGDNEGEGLRLPIPYLGVIRITREGPISPVPSRSNQTSLADLLRIDDDALQTRHQESPTVEQPLSHLHDISQSSTCPEGLPVQLQVPESERPIPQDPSLTPDEMTLNPQLELPSIMADVNDWAFQGVDTAFFDNLMRGTSFGGDSVLER
ncbi:hypothetical protein NM208_g10197 [Fusarium decemcellulare]|uniref:Uncharacterized protein n=1 Tax=Fusarium decemcellulare TaxID=57161 RepID=A0ACC1RYW2_9HYPO|nr:hypothetical protein NM208_g10197 [Fusarium decemcellulare]